MSRPQRHARVSCWLLLIGASIATSVVALDSMDMEIERVEGAGWVATGVVLHIEGLDWTRAHATISRLHLASQSEAVRNLRIECADLQISDAAIACNAAKVIAGASPFGAQQIGGRLVYQRASGALDVDLRNVKLASGTTSVRAAMRDDGWSVRADLNQVAVEGLVKLAESFSITLPGLATSGAISGTVEASGRDAPGTIDADLKVTALTANNAAGSIATDKLTFAVKASARRIAQRWQWQVSVDSSAGQAYAEPVFLDFGARRMALQARGHYSDDRQLVLDDFRIEHQQTLSAAGNARLDLAADQPLRDLRLTVSSLQFPGAYEGYLQPLLLDTSFKSLTTSGSMAGGIHVTDGSPDRLDLTFDGLSIDDATRTIVMKEFSGRWHWLNETPPGDRDVDSLPALQVDDSRLSWTSGVLLNLDLGAGELKFSTRGRQFRLLEPTRLPLLDGAIELESFRVRNAGQPTVAFMVDATIQPISVQRLSKAFGWPEFGGSVGGAISKLRMRDGVITLGTRLTAQVFDGEVSISDLRLEQPFGKWPRFASSIALDNLDLELVTSAFSFGRITGRLSGAINGLQLFNWQPVAFDATLFTPPGDKSRHRISQRAVENIGSIGGGGAGIAQALSSGFLRFFEDFNYDRLGISCRLENEICRMNGVAPGPHGGYYLVKGKGIPRIDVIGGAQRVDWPRLVQQLIAVTESDGPVVR